jgi:cobalt/nickel transport system permease protein
LALTGNGINELLTLEGLAGGASPLHRLHPRAKLLATAAFLVTVLSFDQFALGRLIPFIFYPAVLIPLSDTPFALICKRLVVALPFCLFIGLSNLLLERQTALMLGGFALSFGLLSCLSLLLRACLCVAAVLLLVAVTRLSELTAALRSLHVPAIFVTVLEMTYRYIGVLWGETGSMLLAYRLRGGRAKGVDLRHAGSFVGCLFLRSVDRAERVYAAMRCRGYGGGALFLQKRPFSPKDWAFCALIPALCAVLRLVDLGELLLRLLGGV